VVVLDDLVEELGVGAGFQPGDQRAQRLAHVADETQVDRRAAAEVERLVVDLDDLLPRREEVVVREVRAEHEQQVAVSEGLGGSAPTKQARHPDARRVVRLEHILAAVGVRDGRLEPVRQLEHLLAGQACALAAVDDDLLRTRDHGYRLVERGVGGTRDRQVGEDRMVQHRLVHLLRGDVAREDHHPYAAVEDRRLQREFGGTRHLAS
jgi:hypothetical protein